MAPYLANSIASGRAEAEHLLIAADLTTKRLLPWRLVPLGAGPMTERILRILGSDHRRRDRVLAAQISLKIVRLNGVSKSSWIFVIIHELTGDNTRTADAAATEASNTTVHSELLPEDDAAWLRGEVHLRTRPATCAIAPARSQEKPVFIAERRWLRRADEGSHRGIYVGRQ